MATETAFEEVHKPSEDNERSDEQLKLTNWVNEPSVYDLKQDYEEAQSDHNLHTEAVRNWIHNYDGKLKANIKIKAGRSKIVPKLIRKQAEWRYASLSEPFLSTQDIFNVDPVTWEDKEAARQNELLLNHQFNTKIDKIDFIDTYVRTAVDEGTVVCKVGWHTEEAEVTIKQPVWEYYPVDNPEEAQMMMEQEAQIHAIMERSKDQFSNLPEYVKEAHYRFMRTGIPHKFRKKGYRRVTRKQTVANHPTVEVCRYDQVIIDPTCRGNLDKAEFVIYEFESSLSDLRSDGRYKNLDQIRVGNHLETDDDELNSTFTFQDEPRKKVTVYEYWGYYDINNTGMVEPIVAAWVGNTMIRMEKNPFPDRKPPFIRVKYLPVRHRMYGEPDGHLLEDNQDVMGALTRSMLDMLGRSAVGQQGVMKGALDVTNFRKFENGDDFQINTGFDPRAAVYMGEFPDIPPSADNMMNRNQYEADSITGVKSFSDGITAGSLGGTATGVRGALDATSKREMGILRRLADGVVQIGRKFMAMNAEFLDDAEVIRVTNEEFVEIRRDDLYGHVDIKLTISTAEADAAKAEDLSFMLQTTAQSMDPMLANRILSEIADLRKMPALAKDIREFRPQPDPMQQELQRLEIEKLKAEIRDLNAKAAENEVDRELKSAKAGTERAKARNMDSKSDKQDLDFIEQRTGTTHGREMEKAEHKRRSDLDLKAADALFNSTGSEDKGDPISFMRNFNL